MQYYRHMNIYDTLTKHEKKILRSVSMVAQKRAVSSFSS